MYSFDAKEILDQLDMLEKHHVTITTLLAEIASTAQDNHILSRAQCQNLLTNLEEYSVLLAPLEKAYGGTLPLKRIAELKEELSIHIRKTRLDEALEEANRFYLLDTTNSELLKELEAHKAILNQLVSELAPESDIAPLQPYKSFVKLVEEPNKGQPSLADDFDSVESTFSSRFLRGLWMEQFFLRMPDAPSSGQSVMAETGEDTINIPDKIEGEPSTAEIASENVDSSAEQTIVPEDDHNETEAGLPQIEGVSVVQTTSDDTHNNLSIVIEPGPDQPNRSIKKFIELLRRDSSGGLAFVFARTALSKVASFSLDVEKGSYINECATKLCKRGYIAKVSILSDHIVLHEGYMLTPLGYSFATSKDALNLLCRITGQELKLFPLSPAKMTPETALHSWLVGNYPLACNMPDTEIICRMDDETGLVYAMAKGIDCSLLFVPGIIMAESGEKDVESLRRLYSLAIETGARAFVLILEDQETIQRIHYQVSEFCNQNVTILYAAKNDTKALYKGDGTIIPFVELDAYFKAEQPVDIEGSYLSDENLEADAEDAGHNAAINQDESESTSRNELDVEDRPETNSVGIVDETKQPNDKAIDSTHVDSDSSRPLDIEPLFRDGVEVAEDEDLLLGDSSNAFAEYLLSVSNPLQKFDAQYKLLVSLIAEKSWIEAVALAKTLSEATNNPSQITLYQNILHALNSPLDARHYGSNNSLELSWDTELEKYCRIATMFWSLCFPERPYDYDLRITYKGIGEQIIEEGTPKFPKVKSALAVLNGPIQDTIDEYFGGKGFSPRVLRYISADNTTIEANKSLREQAQCLRDLPRNQIALKGIEEFLKATMGPTSKIGECMRQISQGAEDIHKLIYDTYAPFSTDGFDYSLDAVDAFINNEWDKVKKGPGVRELKNESPARKLINKALKQRLDLLSAWLQLNSTAEKSIDDEVAGKFLNNITAFCDFLRSIQKEMEDYLLSHEITIEEKSGLTLLVSVFKRIYNIIESADENEPQIDALFLEFAKTPWVALNRGGKPILDKSFNDVPGMEPWRMILKHICDSKTDLELVLEEIKTKESPWFAEYTTGGVILSNLGLSTNLYDSKIKEAYESADTKEKEFLGRVRQNCAYGRISEASKETIMMLLEKQKEFFIGPSDEDERSSHNFHHYYMLLHFLDEIQLVEFSERKKTLQQDVEERVSNLPTYETVIPESLEFVKRSIESGNLSMAEEYITRFDTDPHSLEPVNLKQIAKSVKWHEIFLADADMIYEEACNRQSNKNKHPSNWAITFIQQRRYNKWSTPNEKANAEKLIQNWIHGKENTRTPMYLMQFLQALGFQPLEGQLFEKKSAGKMNGQDYEVFIGRLTPSSTRLNSYPHPVAKFGTNNGGTQPIDVNLVCIYGSKAASTLYTVLQGLDIGNNPSIVFMDGSLAVNERKNLAAKFKSQTNARNPMLILDRVLLIFLASLNAGDRLPAFFQCTLPYTFAQLHTQGSGPVPDEMFFGRNADLLRITDPDGDCLVYGGRQLGKTALLKRAKSLNHKPELRQYAFFLDLKDQGLDALVNKLNEALSITLSDNKPLLEKPCANLNELCAALNRRSNAFAYLTILVDEADAFFREIEKDGYKQFHPIAVLRQDTHNRVKFVFAGTHNVAQLRSANDNNKDTLQLGSSLCIKPLSMVDAANLITYPLAYLGFYIDEDQVAMILNNTNRYPGVIHMFCHNLVQVLCSSYSEFYSDKTFSPPYHISEKQMAALFREKDLKKEVGRRVYATITVDQVDRQYEYIARLLAFLEYESVDNETARLYGFTPKEIIECNKEYFEILELMPTHTSIEKVDVVMSEMVDMGILWKKPESSYYRFQQRDFIGYLGSKEENEEALLNYAEESINA